MNHKFKEYLVCEISRAELCRQLNKILPPEVATVRSGPRGDIRISPAAKDSVSIDDIVTALIDIGITVDVQNPIQPGMAESMSGKFLTYRGTDGSGASYYFVVGGGATLNGGLVFERAFSKMIESQLDDQETSPFFIQFNRAIKEKVTFVQVVTEFHNSARRALNGRPVDIGKDISDCTLVDSTGKRYYLSLKAVNGTTISNNGLRGLFIRKGDSVVAAPTNQFDPLLRALCVDKTVIAKLITNFINKKTTKKKQSVQIENYDEDTILAYMKSAIGYGYYYIREKGASQSRSSSVHDQYTIKEFTTEKSVGKYLGMIQSVEIQYPYYTSDAEKSKSTSIRIKTSTGKFQFSLRNKSGGVVPSEITLVN